MAEPQPNEPYTPWASNEWGSTESYMKTPTRSQAPVSATPWQEDWGTGVSYLGNGMPERSGNFTGRGVDNSATGMFDRVVRNLFMQESGNRHRTADGGLVTSPKGARGKGQVMPDTGVDPGFGVKPLQDDSEEENERFTRDYLGAMLQEFDGDYQKALAAYNAGHGSVKKAVAKGGERWMDFLPKRSETVPYVNNIMRGIYRGQEGAV